MQLGICGTCGHLGPADDERPDPASGGERPAKRYFTILRPRTPAAVAAFALAFSCGRSERTAAPACHISPSCMSCSLAAMNSL